MTLSICQECNRYFNIGVFSCPHCGSPISKDPKFLIQGANMSPNMLARNDYENIIICPKGSDLEVSIESNDRFIEAYTIPHENIKEILRVKCFEPINRSNSLHIYYLAFESSEWEKKLPKTLITVYTQTIKLVKDNLIYQEPIKLFSGDIENIYDMGGKLYKYYGDNKLYEFGFNEENFETDYRQRKVIFDNVSNQIYISKSYFLKPPSYSVYYVTDDKERKLMYKTVDPFYDREIEVCDSDVSIMMAHDGYVYYAKYENGEYQLYLASDACKVKMGISMASSTFAICGSWLYVSSEMFLINIITKNKISLPFIKLPSNFKGYNNSFYFWCPDDDEYSDYGRLCKINTKLLDLEKNSCIINPLMEHEIKFSDFNNSLFISKTKNIYF